MKNTILLFLLLIVAQLNYAQSDSLTVKYDKSSVVQKKFDSKKLNSYKKDKDFNYKEVIVKKDVTFVERFFYWLKRQVSRLFEWIFGVKYAAGILGTILQTLPYIIAGLVLFLIVKFFLKVKTNSIVNSGVNKAIVSITEDEELIKNKDILKLIEQAVTQKNYRLAVRYYYLNVLKQLENKDLIDWEQQKTNEDYIKEIAKEPIKLSFEELTRLYDFVWYGNFDINEVEFTRVALNFEKATNLIAKA